MALGNESTKSRKIDIVFCLDATGSMSPCIDSVKANATKFYRDFADKMTSEYNSSIDQLNIKIIAFRDYAEDGGSAMIQSEWFDMTTSDVDSYEQFMDSIVADGGGDNPENGLEALWYAMASDWKSCGKNDRQLIVLFTDDDAHTLGKFKGNPDYPEDMVDEDGLIATWNCVRPSFLSQSDFKLKERNKRLVIFAPPGTTYQKVQSNLNRSQFIPVTTSNGLDEIDFSDIIKILAASASSH